MLGFRIEIRRRIVVLDRGRVRVMVRAEIWSELGNRVG